MAINIGPKIGIEGEAEYRKQLNNIITETKTLHAEMRSMESAFDKDTSAKEKAEKQTEALNRAIEAQEKRVAEVSRGLEESKRKFGENDERTMRWRQALANAETELHNLENELKAIPNSVQLLGQSMQDTGEKIEKVGKTMTTVGRTMTRTITTPILALGTAAVKITSDFDTSMSKVQAISGATGSDFDALRSKAREMGAETKYSASEAADAMTYMAMAGWKTEDMLQGVEGIMYLAAASGEDLATTSDIVTDALTAFGKSAEESGHLADIMAAASSNANTNVGLMGETFKYVAPVAGALNFSMEDTAVAIGLMANNAIKGSQAGTSLRSILTRMAKPTKESQEAMDALGISMTNSDGSMRSLEDIMQDLRSSFSGLTEAEQTQYAAMLAGQRGMSGLLAIVNSAPADYKKLRQAVDNSTGSAKNMATTMQNNLAGQLTILKSELQELAISFGDLLVPHIRKAVEWVQNQVTAFSQLDNKTKGQIIRFAAFAAAVGPVITIVGKMATGIGTLASIVGKAVEMVGTLGIATSAAVGAFGVATAGAVALGIGLRNLYEKYGDSADSVSAFSSSVEASIEQTKASRNALENATSALDGYMESTTTTMDGVEASATLARQYADELIELSNKTERTADEQYQMEVVLAELKSIYPEFRGEIDEATGSLNMSEKEIRENISALEEMARVQAYQKIYQDLLEKIVTAEKAKAEATVHSRRMAEQAAEAEEKRNAIMEAAAAEQREYDNALAAYNALLDSGTATTEELTSAENRLTNASNALNDGYVELNGELINVDSAMTTYADVQNDASSETQSLEEATANANAEIEEAEQQMEDAKQVAQEMGIDITGLSGSLDDSAESADGASGSYSDLGDAAGDAAEDIEDATSDMTTAYDDAYNAALKSMQGQSSLYEEMAESEAQSYQSIVDNMNAHINAMENWNSNVIMLTNDARYGVDEAYTGMINDAVALGQDHAEVIAAYAQQYTDNEGDLSAAAEAWARAQDVSEITADIQAKNELALEYGTENTLDALNDGIISAKNILGRAKAPLKIAGTAAGKAATDGETAGVKGGIPALDVALSMMPTTTLSQIKKVAELQSQSRSAGGNVVSSGGQGAQSAMPVVTGAMTNLTNSFHSALTKVNNMKGTATSAGNAVSSGAASGTQQGNTKVGTANNAMVGRFQTGISRVLALKGQAQQAGSTVGSSTAAGMQGTVGRVTTASNRIKTAAENPLKGMQNNTYTWGEHATTNFANGLSSSTAVSRVSSKASAIARIVANKLKHTTPKEGPLKDDDVWGEHLAENFAKGMDNGARTVAAAAENLGFAAEAGMSEAVSIDPAVISGRSGLSATISHIIGGGIDPAAIYAAVRDGAAAAETSVVIGEREFARILRNAGVAWA